MSLSRALYRSCLPARDSTTKFGFEGRLEEGHLRITHENAFTRKATGVGILSGVKDSGGSVNDLDGYTGFLSRFPVLVELVPLAGWRSCLAALTQVEMMRPRTVQDPGIHRELPGLNSVGLTHLVPPPAEDPGRFDWVCRSVFHLPWDGTFTGRVAVLKDSD